MCYGVHVPAAAAIPVRSKRNEALCELRRTEILAAAIKLFGRKGFDATRAEDIATAARLAKGTLYLYFKSKEAIYTAAVTRAVRELREELGRRTSETHGFRERLAVNLRVRLLFWQEHEAIYRLLLTLGREARHRRQTNALLRLAHGDLMGIFAEGVAAGEVATMDFGPLAWAALDMVRGANERRMDSASATTPEEDAAWITACVLRQVPAAAYGPLADQPS